MLLTVWFSQKRRVDVITILCNDKKMQLDQAVSLYDFIVSAGYTTCMYAVAVNREFMPREAQANYQLQDGDAVDIVSPMQGG